MKHIIHVHQQRIRKGLPAIIDRTWRGSRHSVAVGVICPSCGAIAARVVQSPTPDRCGARVWIEAEETDTVGHQSKTVKRTT